MSTRKIKKIFVGMSGGVDSSVAAALLKNNGYDVVGVFIKSYNVDGCSEQDVDDARRVAEQLKIPFYVFDLEKEYKEKVVQYMIDGYKNGLTPNPDVMCNKEIKFGLFLKRALELGADYVATGHYVRLRVLVPELFEKHAINFPTEKIALALGLARLPAATTVAARPARRFFEQFRHQPQAIYQLYSARDKNKDQSYFLWTLTQKQLKHCLFPIGDYTKPQVRQIAKKFGLITAGKKDSQGICFLGKVSLPEFLESYLPKKKGVVLNMAGEKIGEHNGAHFYTIGQRHGLGIGGSAKPMYIAKKDVKENSVVVAEGESNPALYKKEVNLTNVNFINNIRTSHVHIFARVRYRQPLFKAQLWMSNIHSGKLVFDKAQKFVAPGQSAVFYWRGPSFAKASAGKEMLGGGVII